MVRARRKTPAREHKERRTKVKVILGSVAEEHEVEDEVSDSYGRHPG